MGSPTISQRRELKAALRTGDYRVARQLLDSLCFDADVTDTLRVSVLAAKEEPGDFDRIAGRFVRQAVFEEVLDLPDLLWLPALAEDVRRKPDTSGQGFLELMRTRLILVRFLRQDWPALAEIKKLDDVLGRSSEGHLLGADVRLALEELAGLAKYFADRNLHKGRSTTTRARRPRSEGRRA